MTDLPRYSLYLRLLRWSLSIGAIYDLLLAGTMAFAPALLAGILKVPTPDEPFYLWLIAVILVMLAAFYALGAYDPHSYRGNILVAIFGRILAGGVLIFAGWTGELPGLYLAAAGDLVFGVAHAVFYWPVRR